MQSSPWTNPMLTFERSLDRFPRASTSRGRFAQILCERFGLEPLPTGSPGLKTRLLILDRFDYLSIVGVLAVMPHAEVAALTLPLDMDPKTCAPLEVWNCGASIDNFRAVVEMRLAQGKRVIIGQEHWAAIAHHGPIDQAVLVATDLEPSPNAGESGVSYHLHMHLGDRADSGLEVSRYCQSQDADRLKERPLR